MTKKVYDFSAKKKIWFLIPLILIVGIIVFTVIRGVEIAIEFKGGTIISYSSEVECDVNSVKKDIEERNHTEGREPFRKRRYVFNFFQL